MALQRGEEPLVALDAMGGDHGPEPIVAGGVQAARAGVRVALVGDRALLEPLLPAGVSIPIWDAGAAVAMGDDPVAGLRRRPDASIAVAMEGHQTGRAQAVVSCGHTGATLVAAVTRLGVLQGVDRPAVATWLPRADGGRLLLLDAGANVDGRPEQLVDFARLGAAYAAAEGIASPRVGLLSNGEEDRKGNAQGRATLPLLRAVPGLNVVGNIEPTTAMAGGCDVLVTDGFVGNVLLKAAEGAMATVVSLLRQEMRRSPTAALGRWLLAPAFARFRKRIAWDAHGGALLLGVQGVVIVGHGRANASAVAAAIRVAEGAVRSGVLDAVRQAVAAPPDVS